MKRFTRPALALVFLLLSSLACQTLSGGSDAPPPPEGASGPKVLFQDDFSDSGSGWDSVRKEEGVTDYENGAYRIFVNTDNMDVWANPGLSFTDVRIEVDATKAGGPDDNDFGVICRYEDVDNFYFFIISSDGYYGIGKVSGGEQNLIGADKMDTNDAIRQGNATNHITVECVGSTLSLSVNGTHLQTVEDADFSSGDVGLLAGTYDEPGTDILFDNFVVTVP